MEINLIVRKYKIRNSRYSVYLFLDMIIYSRNASFFIRWFIKNKSYKSEMVRMVRSHIIIYIEYIC